MTMAKGTGSEGYHRAPNRKLLRVDHSMSGGSETYSPKSNLNLLTADHDPDSKAYLIINGSLAAIFLLVIAYAAVFDPVSANHPVPCVYTAITGEACASCGLSRGMSYAVRMNVTQARLVNAYSPIVLFFFAAQVLMRVVVSLLLIKWKRFINKLVIADALLSAGMLIAAFLPFLL